MKFRNWEIIADKKYNDEIYSNLKGGIADGCQCNDCRNFVKNRQDIFPQEIKTLLAELGIDYTKEADNIHLQKLKNGLHSYLALFHFRGEITKLEDETGLLPLNDNLIINFGLPDGQILFPNVERLVQIEFYIEMPWTIEKELESD
ncbi:hypothetical protein HYN48_13940 [Flavobacterium magnum]|uniref:Uncharacterized protein n=1 Tax=Flavobacterium magnum TaxID=2162713 RepID=A0A2S0RIK4_9FLAO|nr:hypothetical protein [Flavobacterium magnum]AWA31100.1 hypothetical protein HYN48_13940 [Flavobacterium magnum]